MLQDNGTYEVLDAGLTTMAKNGLRTLMMGHADQTVAWYLSVLVWHDVG